MNVKWQFDDFKNFEQSLLNDSFGIEMKAATEDTAKLALTQIKNKTPKVTGTLKVGWNGNSCKPKATATGFASEMINAVPYARHVNDGHRVKNKADGAYYKVKRRIKVPVASEYQADPSEWYGFEHFFVEKGLKSTKEKTKQIVDKRMDKWWKERFK